MKQVAGIFIIMMLVASPALADDAAMIAVGKNYVDSGLRQKASSAAVIALESFRDRAAGFATADQGALADSAVQPATVGNLDALTTSDKTNIVSAINEVNARDAAQADWNASSGPAQILNRPAFGTTAGTIAAGDDSRFDTIPTGVPSGNSPSGRAFIWVEP